LIDRRLASSRLNPDYLADVLGVSRRTLYAAFEADGRSVASTIRHARLERARSLLSRADHATMSVTDVAAGCGFTSLAHFSRLFRAEFGSTPSGYRQRRT
jgi:transcriptional regulator GlxA family with amidase domain